MLVRLLVDQIAKHWDILSYAIEQSLPPAVNSRVDRMNSILASVLAGDLHCWVSVDKAQPETIGGVVTTTFTYDKHSDTKNLLVYTVYGFGDFAKDAQWRDGLAALQKWAVANGCHRVVGYTNVRSIADFVKKIGGTADYIFITIPTGFNN